MPFAISRSRSVIRVVFHLVLLLGIVASAAGSAPSPEDLAAIDRAKRLELPTKPEPPPGNALDHDAAGYAQVMCNAVFITGLEPAYAAEHVGYFTAPYAARAKLGVPVIDRMTKSVTVTVPGGVTRLARYIGSQGCLAFPIGETKPHFTPEVVSPRLPDGAKQPWPMGDRLPKPVLPPGLEAKKLQAAVDAAFASPEGFTMAYVVTWKGRIIAERYGPGVDLHTRLESWSMGKSVTASLMGILIGEGSYDLWQKAPIPEWQSPGDPRADIRIADLLRMSSGLRIRAPYDPDYDPSGPYPEHLYLYTGTVNSFHYAASRQLQWPPNTVGRYRNTDPVLINYLIRLAVEKSGRDYLAFPQRALFDQIGIRSMVIETDPYGDLLTQGYDLASARDWARLGNLYLNGGVWQGKRILPKGYTDFVRTVAPAWQADGRPVYGGFFWVNGDGALPVPKDAYYMAGAGGQTTMIIPSYDLVIVRLGHFKGEVAGQRDFEKSLALLLQAIPASTDR